MSQQTERHLELIALTRPLLRYARAREPDLNASFLLVHRALSRAFAEPAHGLRPLGGLEASLRADIDHAAAARGACA